MKKMIILLAVVLAISPAIKAQTLHAQKANAAGQQGTIKDSTNLGLNYGNTTEATSGGKVAKGKKAAKSNNSTNANRKNATSTARNSNNAANNSPNNADAR